MRLLLDCDGVMADFTGALLPHIACLLDRRDNPPTDDEITEFDIAAAFGLPPALVYEPVGLAGFCRNLEPYPGAAEGIEVLRKRGVEVRACTTPFDSDHWSRERERWLVEKMGFDRKHIIQVHEKEICAGAALIDDKTSTLVKWQAEYPSARAIQFVRPWNKRDAWEGSRVADWPSLVTTVLGLKRARKKP